MVKPAPLSLFAALVLLFLAGPALAQQFSAEMVPVGPGAQQAKLPAQKIYVSDGKMRTEIGGPTGRVMIADTKTGTVYMIVPQQKTYMELPRMNERAAAWTAIDPEDACPQWQEMARKSGRPGSDGWTCTRVAQETIDDRRAVKYQAKAPDGEQFFAWIDLRLRFMTKTLDDEGDGMELHDIREGPQPGTLFELPSGYKKLDMPVPQPLSPPPPPPGGKP